MKVYKMQYTFTGEVEFDAKNEEEAKKLAEYKAYESCAYNNDFIIDKLEEKRKPTPREVGEELLPIFREFIENIKPLMEELEKYKK